MEDKGDRPTFAGDAARHIRALNAFSGSRQARWFSDVKAIP
jgi:hypothetical protein